MTHRLRPCGGLLVLAAVLLGARAPESNPPSSAAGAAPASPAPPTPDTTGAALVWLLNGGKATVDIVMVSERDPAPVRAAILRLQDGTGWTLSSVQVSVKSTARLDRALPPLKQTAASFTLAGPLLQEEGTLPIAVFAGAFAELAPFSCTFAVPPGLHISALERWEGVGVGARLRPGNSPGMYEYYIAAPQVLAALEPEPEHTAQPVAPAPAPPAAVSPWWWLALAALVVGGASMVRLYVARRSRRLTGGRDGSRSTLPTRRRETGV